MRHRCEHDTHHGDENQAAEERVSTGKELGIIVWQITDGPHAAEDHGGIQDGIHPAKSGDVVVAENAESKRCRDDREGERCELYQTPKKDMTWCDGVLT